MPAVRTLAVYALALGVGTFVLEWLDYRHFTQSFPTDVYLALVALGFVALGVWAGRRLTPGPAPARFERNEKAVAALGLTPRECEVLELLASGRSLKEMAKDLALSPNTVKTHVANVYQKLEVQRRLHAVEKARELALIASPRRAI